ncbi:hypothetical protein Tco_1035582, partial [Tanacetum coccineum]
FPSPNNCYRPLIHKLPSLIVFPVPWRRIPILFLVFDEVLRLFLVDAASDGGVTGSSM